MTLAETLVHIVLLSVLVSALLYAHRPLPGTRRGHVGEQTLWPYRPRFEGALFIVVPLLPMSIAVAMNPQHWSILYWCQFGFGSVVMLSFPKARLRLGTDGLCVERFGRRRFIAWTDFIQFEQTPRGIRAETKAGFVRIGRARGHDPGLLARLKADADALRGVLGHSPTDANEADWLTRTYRSQDHDPMQLLAVLLDPRTTTGRIPPALLKEAYESRVSPRSLRILRLLVP